MNSANARLSTFQLLTRRLKTSVSRVAASSLMSSVVALSTDGVLVATVAGLVAEATARSCLRNLPLVHQWAQAAASEAASIVVGSVEVGSEEAAVAAGSATAMALVADVVVADFAVATVADAAASATTTVALSMHLLAHEAGMVAATTVAPAAMLISSPCLPVVRTAVAEAATAIATTTMVTVVV